MWVVVLVLRDVSPVSLSRLAVVPDGPYEDENVAGNGLHYNS